LKGEKEAWSVLPRPKSNQGFIKLAMTRDTIYNSLGRKASFSDEQKTILTW